MPMQVLGNLKLRPEEIIGKANSIIKLFPTLFP